MGEIDDMASWRDTASQQAQDDVDGLLESALGFAQQQLDKYREFYPYAVVVHSDGQQRMVAADIGNEQPPSADVITTLIASLGEQREQLRAVDRRRRSAPGSGVVMPSGSLRNTPKAWP